jgi:hypothetical protein
MLRKVCALPGLIHPKIGHAIIATFEKSILMRSDGGSYSPDGRQIVFEAGATAITRFT